MTEAVLAACWRLAERERARGARLRHRGNDATARCRFCRCRQGRPRPTRTITRGTGPRRCLPRSTLKAGQVVGETPRRHRSIKFRKFLDRIDASVPPELDVHVSMNNYGTHNTPLIRAWFVKRPRPHVLWSAKTLDVAYSLSRILRPDQYLTN